MPRLPRSASKADKQASVKAELHKFKIGELHSGSPNGPLVSNKRQALAIALSVSGQSRKKRAKSKKRSLPFVKGKR